MFPPLLTGIVKSTEKSEVSTNIGASSRGSSSFWIRLSHFCQVVGSEKSPFGISSSGALVRGTSIAISQTSVSYMSFPGTFTRSRTPARRTIFTEFPSSEAPSGLFRNIAP